MLCGGTRRLIERAFQEGTEQGRVNDPVMGTRPLPTMAYHSTLTEGPLSWWLLSRSLAMAKPFLARLKYCTVFGFLLFMIFLFFF